MAQIVRQRTGLVPAIGVQRLRNEPDSHRGSAAVHDMALNMAEAFSAVNSFASVISHIGLGRARVLTIGDLKFCS